MATPELVEKISIFKSKNAEFRSMHKILNKTIKFERDHLRCDNRILSYDEFLAMEFDKELGPLNALKGEDQNILAQFTESVTQKYLASYLWIWLYVPIEYPRIATFLDFLNLFGEEEGDLIRFEGKSYCGWCGEEMGNHNSCTYHFIQFDGGQILERNRVDLDCECGVRRGGFHHPVCDGERCPRCGEQAYGGGCCSESQTLLVHMPKPKVPRKPNVPRKPPLIAKSGRKFIFVKAVPGEK